MKIRFSAFLIASLVITGSCFEPDHSVPKTGIWSAVVGGAVIGGENIFVNEQAPSPYHDYIISALKVNSPSVIFYFDVKPSIGTYDLEAPAYDPITNTMTNVASYCPEYTNGCVNGQNSTAGQITLTKLDADSLVAHFWFETDNLMVSEGLIKARVVVR